MIFYFLFLISFITIFIQQKKINNLNDNMLSLTENYDKLCNVLAGEIDVEDVKKKLEGKVEQKALPESEFPLNLKQLEQLRKIGRKNLGKGEIQDWKNLKSSILPYTLLGRCTGYYNTNKKDLFLKLENAMWEIIDEKNHDVLNKWGSLNDYDHSYIVVDALKVKKVLENVK